MNTNNDTPEHRSCCWTNCCEICCSVQFFAKQSASNISYSIKHASWLEREQMDESYVQAQYMIPGRWIPQSTEDDSAKEMAILCENKLNEAFHKNNLTYRHVMVLNASKRYTARTQSKLAIMFKEMPAENESQKNELGNESNNACLQIMRRPIFLFNIVEETNIPQIEIQYQEECLFEEVKGGRLEMLNGDYMPRIGVHCPPDLDDREAEELIRDALELGCRLFDLTFFINCREDISTTIKKYLVWHELRRNDIFISVKINIIRPESMQNYANNNERAPVFPSVVDYIDHCIECCVRAFRLRTESGAPTFADRTVILRKPQMSRATNVAQPKKRGKLAAAFMNFNFESHI